MNRNGDNGATVCVNGSDNEGGDSSDDQDGDENEPPLFERQETLGANRLTQVVYDSNDDSDSSSGGGGINDDNYNNGNLNKKSIVDSKDLEDEKLDESDDAGDMPEVALSDDTDGSNTSETEFENDEEDGKRDENEIDNNISGDYHCDTVECGTFDLNKRIHKNVNPTSDLEINFGVEHGQDDNDNDKNSMERAMNENETDDQTSKNQHNGGESKNTTGSNIDYNTDHDNRREDDEYVFAGDGQNVLSTSSNYVPTGAIVDNLNIAIVNSVDSEDVGNNITNDCDVNNCAAFVIRPIGTKKLGDSCNGVETKNDDGTLCQREEREANYSVIADSSGYPFFSKTRKEVSREIGKNTKNMKNRHNSQNNTNDVDNDNDKKENMSTDKTNKNLLTKNTNTVENIKYESSSMTQTNVPFIVQSSTSPTGAYSQANNDFDEDTHNDDKGDNNKITIASGNSMPIKNKLKASHTSDSGKNKKISKKLRKIFKNYIAFHKHISKTFDVRNGKICEKNWNKTLRDHELSFSSIGKIFRQLNVNKGSYICVTDIFAMINNEPLDYYPTQLKNVLKTAFEKQIKVV